MNIAQFAVARPVAVVMRVAAFILLGAVCLMRLPVDLLPKVSLPTLNVTTQWPNVAPEEIEAQITRPMEQAVSSVPGMYQVTSSTSEGTSTVRIQFRWGVDIGQAAVDVLQLVQRAKRGFPDDDTISEPVVGKFDPNQFPILTYGVSGIRDTVKLRTIMDNQVSPIIESADGVSAADVSGGDARAIIVNIDPDRLRAHHLVLSNVTRRLVEENINLPAGVGKQGNTEYTIRSLGWFTSVDQIRKLPVGVFNGQPVSLQDIAEITDFHTEKRSYTRLNGEPSVSLRISKQSEANTITTAKNVFEKIEQIKKIYPELKFGLAFDQSAFIARSVADVKTSAIIGGILAVLILLFFLRNVRSTLVVALSIPTSIISTFALLYMCGFTLNTMSLGGLALATGLIVDDAVVVLENIFRHIERDKKSAREAAVSATNEILSAVVASTWTVMVVFLPLLLIKGQAGQMFTQFALVVIFSLGVSLLDATTTVPMLATKLVSGEAHHENIAAGAEHPSIMMRMFHRFGEWFDTLDKSYRQRLEWALHHRGLTLIGVAALTGVSFLLVPMLGTELMPQTDSGDCNVNIRMPVGTALDQTNQIMLRAEKIIRANPDVYMVLASAGGRNPASGSLTVKLRDDRKSSTQEIMGDLRKQLFALPGANARLSQFDIVGNMMTGGTQSVDVNIFGPDLDVLSQLGRSALGPMSEVPGLENVDVNWQDAMPEMQWKVDRDKAAQLGISFADIAGTISTATTGKTASYYQEGGFQYPIRVQMPESARKTELALGNLIVSPSLDGDSTGILLRQVAHAEYGMGPSQITRMNRQRYIAVGGAVQGRKSSEIQKDVENIMSSIRLPSGYYWDWGLSQKRRAEEFAGMGVAVILAIALIYMLLAAQFESYIHPLTILFSVPLAAIGVILALFITGRSFGLTAFIGVLMLVGIVVKNGILLVDYTNTLRKRGLKREEAILAAGPTRLRPILMTASAAALGMLPIATGLGEGSEIQAPMATAVIGGLCTSTFLTLFVVPIAYTLLDDAMNRLHLRRQAKTSR